jgi:hypothetical protein
MGTMNMVNGRWLNPKRSLIAIVNPDDRNEPSQSGEVVELKSGEILIHPPILLRYFNIISMISSARRRENITVSNGTMKHWNS